MAFNRKTWVNRIVQFPGRRQLKDTTTQVNTIVDVTRYEGTVTQQGDTFDAANMNDLEGRIASEFSSQSGSITELQDRKAVRADISQSFTDSEKGQARSNIDAAAGDVIKVNRVLNETVEIGAGLSVFKNFPQMSGYRCIGLGCCYCGGTDAYTFNLDRNEDNGSATDRVCITNRTDSPKSLSTMIYLIYQKK